MVDLGSGQLDFNGAEPSVEEAMAAGAHVVCMSGDKLLGVPRQALSLRRQRRSAVCAVIESIVHCDRTKRFSQRSRARSMIG